MPATSSKPPKAAETELKFLPEQVTSAQTVIAWSGFLFALLQSVCTFFTALDGLRLLIGAGALIAVFQAGTVWDHFHANWIRVPMVVLAFVGSVLNLLILRRIWAASESSCGAVAAGAGVSAEDQDGTSAVRAGGDYACSDRDRRDHTLPDLSSFLSLCSQADQAPGN